MVWGPRYRLGSCMRIFSWMKTVDPMAHPHTMGYLVEMYVQVSRSVVSPRVISGKLNIYVAVCCRPWQLGLTPFDFSRRGLPPLPHVSLLSDSRHPQPRKRDLILLTHHRLGRPIRAACILPPSRQVMTSVEPLSSSRSHPHSPKGPALRKDVPHSSSTQAAKTPPPFPPPGVAPCRQ
ncbi:hypothetical protein LY76DRAFT_225698 [Colletotrichum caudatum]|nr:hypothetical protein LY76DRAFT_225698 [Colletotrichum caudatum]